MSTDLILGGAITFFGALIRWRLHGLSAYSPADEAIYARQADIVRRSGLDGYQHSLVAPYLADPRAWHYPSPSRFGWIWLCALAMRFGLERSPRGIAAISAAAGVASLALAMAIAHQLAGHAAMLIAGALMLVAPLHLHLGRRGLQDEAVCAATLLALWATLGGSSWSMLAAFVLLLSLKEAALLAWPALAIAALMRGPQLSDAIAFVGAPLIYTCALAFLCDSSLAVLHLARAIHVGQKTPYSAKLQTGPKHRGLIDLVAISPAAVMLAATTLVSGAADPASPLTLFVVALIAAHGAAPVQNVRFIASADVVVRILAALCVARAPIYGQLMLPLLVAVDWHTFRAVFLTSGIYDTVTYNLLRAQRAVP